MIPIPAAIKPYVYGGAALLIGAALVAGGYGLYQAGRTAAEADWKDAQIEELTLANKEILRLDAKLIADERDHAARLADISKYYQEVQKRDNEKRQRDVAAARAGDRVLRVQWDRSQGDLTTGDEAAASTTGCDAGTGCGLRGQAGVDLPSEVSARLYELAYDCNARVKQLSRCQDVVRSDRGIPRKGGDPDGR